ncbi:MAG: alpha/beta hydrolase [Treponema sp.]|nr:alpha/beta hydrolase [Treponema sp.]
MKKALALLILACIFKASAKDKFVINIWDDVPAMKHERVICEVTIPDNFNGSSVVICPGGSYHHLGIVTEGRSTAKCFNEKGTASFVLWYRVAKNNWHYPAMMQDIQRMIQLIRENSSIWKTDSKRVAAIGFSAGGHLVCWAGENGNRINLLEPLGIKTEVSLRPDFSIPVYPVVTMDADIGHEWSRKSLLNSDYNKQSELREALCLEKNVPDDMVPTYLVACEDDPVVIYENSVRLSKALEEKNADFVFKTYPWGGHGFGMTNGKFMKTFRWNKDLFSWLEERGFFSPLTE